MTRATRKWIDGLLRALFSGIGGTMGVMVVDPSDFNFGNAGKLALVALIMGGIQVVQFLAKTPTPPDEIVMPLKKSRIRALSDNELAQIVGGHNVETVRDAVAHRE